MATYTMSRGDTRTFTETVGPTGLGSGGVTGWSFWLTVKSDWSDADTAAIFQKIPSQWQISQAGNATTPGIVYCVVAASDTAALPPWQVTGVYDVQAKDGAGNIFTLERGAWVIQPDATQATA